MLTTVLYENCVCLEVGTLNSTIESLIVGDRVLSEKMKRPQQHLELLFVALCLGCMVGFLFYGKGFLSISITQRSIVSFHLGKSSHLPPR